MITPLDRLKQALVECPHERGRNGRRHQIKLRGKDVWVTDNPVVEVQSDDVTAVAAAVPEDRGGRIVNDLRDGCADVPGRVVGIHVDDCYHLIEAASGEPYTPVRPAATVPAAPAEPPRDVLAEPPQPTEPQPTVPTNAPQPTEG